MGVLEIALAGTALYAAVVGAAVLGQRLIAFPWWIDARKSPVKDSLHAAFQEIEIATADGMKLKALWLPPRGSAPVVLTLHGIRGFHWINAARFAGGRWAEAGCGVLAPAFRGYHGSSGWPDEHGLLTDAEAAISFVRAAASGSDVILHGHSLGSSVAVATSTRFGCKLLILESPFTSLPDVGARWYPFLPVRRFMRDRFPTLSLIKWAKADRIVVLHGTADRFIPIAMGEKVARAREGVSFVALAGRGHTGFHAQADEALSGFMGWPESGEAVPS